MTDPITALVEHIRRTVEAHNHDPEQIDPDTDRCRYDFAALVVRFRFALAQAIHHIWKRDPKVAELEREVARLKGLEEELALIREAVRDLSLSDGAVRVVASGTQPPTPDDIEWAKRSIGLDPSVKGEP